LTRIGERNLLLLECSCRKVKKWSKVELEFIIENYKL
jgi:hypothetical protein